MNNWKTMIKKAITGEGQRRKANFLIAVVLGDGNPRFEYRHFATNEIITSNDF